MTHTKTAETKGRERGFAPSLSKIVGHFYSHQEYHIFTSHISDNIFNISFFILFFVMFTFKPSKDYDGHDMFICCNLDSAMLTFLAV